MALFQTFKDIRRSQEILNVLIRNGFGYIFKGTAIEKRLIFKRIGKIQTKLSIPERIRIVMEELGGTFVKLGQLLSLRPDLVPIELSEEFKKLQDQVRPFPTPKAKTIIENELGKKITSMFRDFSKEPIASASIGQVYTAQLKDGRKVVIKVQRPKVEENMMTDIDIMKKFVNNFKDHEVLGRFDLMKIIDEFERYTREELDYKIEARNIDAFHENFKNDNAVKIPKVHWGYTTSKVLTMEYIGGIKIKDLDGGERINKKQIAKSSAAFFLKQVFRYGFYHGDPHPGNILVMNKNKIGLIDFGICGKIAPTMKEKLSQIFISIMSKDTEGVVDGIFSVGLVPDDTDREQIKIDIEEAFMEYYNTSMGQVDMGSSFNEMLDVTKKYQVTLPRSFIMLGKAITTAEGLGRQLDKDFNLTQVAQPFIKEEMQNALSPKKIALRSINEINKYKRIIQNIPIQLSLFLRKANAGNLKFKTESKSIDRLAEEVKHSGVRRSYTTITVTFLIIATFLLLNGNNKLAYTGYIISIILLFMIPKA